jgi:cyclopropane fatty-acyl-phospholipid synthase-like methyltransferase
MSDKPDAPATRRNQDAILTVLKDAFADRHRVLEIGSGTGQHAVFFATALPQLTWQTSDRVENHAGIRGWIDDAGPDNVLSPLALDVDDAEPSPGTFDAVFSANTAHIMSYPSVRRMFRFVGQALEPGGVFCLYGPFNVGGEFTSDSNAWFDQSLRSRDPAMGIRDLEALIDLAGEHGMSLHRRYAMPANNQLLVWNRND